jgi:microcin C transport system permease protein
VFKYLLKRLLLLIPTIFGITLLTFVIINLAPGSPIEQKLQQLQFGGGSSSTTGTVGVSEEVLEALKVQYGFDKPVHIRYLIWLKNLVTLDFGDSFSYEEPVIDVILSKFPVSLQFGLISFFLSYLISIPLGIYKAVKHGGTFDVVSSVLLFIAYSIVPFMLGILLIVFFAGGSFLDLFPIGGVSSDNYETLSIWGKFTDRLHHFFLPLICYTIGSFTTIVMLMKNSILDEIKKDYIRTARAKGLDEKAVYLKHALRNALIPIVTGLGGFLSIFFAGSILLEQVFQLDGIGLLSYTSVLARDYNVIMGLIFLQSLAMLVGNIMSDIAYVWVDPRIDFD